MSAGFKVPTCECGHAEGDHKSNGSRINLQFGVCLVKTCECKQFRQVEKP